MKNRLTVILYLCGFAGAMLLASCENRSDVSLSQERSTEKNTGPWSSTLNNQPVPEGILLLNDSEELEGLSADLTGNLYGRFFYNRAEFFVIDNPENTLYNSKVKLITMFYLDGQLSQTKYDLTDNVSERLIKAYGNFSILGFDLKNRELITTERIVTNSPSGIVVNSLLDNYEMKWSVGNKQIRFRVELSNSKTPFIYTERLVNYESKFRKIERAG